MCSIGGFISEKPVSTWVARGLARALIFYGSPRGTQSSGLWIHGQVLKKAMKPEEFIDLPEVEDLLSKEGATMCLTHTRQPTSGGLGDQQAQPFQIGSTICVHNGMFTNSVEVAEEYGLEKPSGVDSEILPVLLEHLGLDKFIEAANKLRGSVAAAMFHQGKLYLARDTGALEVLRLVDPDTGGAITIFGSTDTQIGNSVRHVWLLSSHVRAETLPMSVFGELTAKELVKLGRIDLPLGRVTHSYHGSGHGLPLIGAGSNGHVSEEERDWTLGFTEAERAAIYADTSLPEPHREWGYGWRKEMSTDGVVTWRYDRELSKKQKLKWPPGFVRDRRGIPYGNLTPTERSGGSRRQRRKKQRRQREAAAQDAPASGRTDPGSEVAAQQTSFLG